MGPVCYWNGAQSRLKSLCLAESESRRGEGASQTDASGQNRQKGAGRHHDCPFLHDPVRADRPIETRLVNHSHA